jgi:hypothetical protein
MIFVNKEINKLETWEIINYLRDKRGYHVLVNFTRDMYFNEFGIRFSDATWNEFVRYADGLDNQHMFERAECYFRQWYGDKVINRSIGEGDGNL